MTLPHMTPLPLCAHDNAAVNKTKAEKNGIEWNIKMLRNMPHRRGGLVGENPTLRHMR